MAKKQNDNPTFSTHHVVQAGFYSDDVRSHQAVEFLKGTQMSYQQDSLQRECEMRKVFPLHPCDPSRRVSNQEMYQGQYTQNLHSPVKDQYDGGKPQHDERDMF